MFYQIAGVILFYFHFGTALEAFVGGHLPIPCAGSAAVRHDRDNSVIILGGRNSSQELDGIWRFDLETGIVTTINHFPLDLGYGSAEIDLDGNIYYFGGFSRQNYLNSVYMLSGEKETRLVQIANLPYPVAQQSSAFDPVGGHIYLFGGQGYGFPYPTIVRFSVTTFESQIIGDLGTTLYGSTATWNINAAFIFGGVTNGYFSSQISKFDPVTLNVDKVDESLSTELVTPAAAANGHLTYVVGGYPAFAKHHHLTTFDSNTGISQHSMVTNLPKYLDTTAVIFDPRSNSIYTFGGSDMASTRGEIFRIPLE